MRKAEAVQQIEEHYGTSDASKIYVCAASERVGTEHEEILMPDGTSYCRVCGTVDDCDDADPIFHPEQYL